MGPRLVLRKSVGKLTARSRVSKKFLIPSGIGILPPPTWAERELTAIASALLPRKHDHDDQDQDQRAGPDADFHRHAHALRSRSGLWCGDGRGCQARRRGLGLHVLQVLHEVRIARLQFQRRFQIGQRLLELIHRHISVRPLSEGHGVVRIFRDRNRIIGDGFVPFPQVVVDEAAALVRDQIIRIQLDRLVQVRESGVELVLPQLRSGRARNTRAHSWARARSLS